MALCQTATVELSWCVLYSLSALLSNKGFLPALLDLDPISCSQHPTDRHNDDNALLYASTIIEALRRERDYERASHEHTREAAQSRIRHFEARIARLEAELEGCVFHSHGLSHFSGGADGASYHDLPVSQEDDVIFSAIVSRNRRLEGEIETIASQASISYFSHLDVHTY